MLLSIYRKSGQQRCVDKACALIADQFYLRSCYCCCSCNSVTVTWQSNTGLLLLHDRLPALHSHQLTLRIGRELLEVALSCLSKMLFSSGVPIRSHQISAAGVLTGCPDPTSCTLLDGGGQALMILQAARKKILSG